MPGANPRLWWQNMKTESWYAENGRWLTERRYLATNLGKWQYG